MLEFRKSARLAPLAIPLEFRRQQDTHRGVLTDLSKAGAFLSTAEALQAGEILPVRIQLPHPFGEILGEVSVVWTSDRQSLGFYRLPCGAGLSFNHFVADGWRRLRAFLSAGAQGRHQLGPLRPNGERLFSRRASR